MAMTDGRGLDYAIEYCVKTRPKDLLIAAGFSLPQFCITLGQRGHGEPHSNPWRVQRARHFFCGGRLGGEISGIGQGALRRG